MKPWQTPQPLRKPSVFSSCDDEQHSRCRHDSNNDPDQDQGHTAVGGRGPGLAFLLLWLGMIPASHFYDKTTMSGNEIHDIVSYYMLPEEINP